MLRHLRAPRWGDSGSGTEEGCSQARKSFSSFRSWFCAELPVDTALLGRAEAQESLAQSGRDQGEVCKAPQAPDFRRYLIAGPCKYSSLPWG